MKNKVFLITECVFYAALIAAMVFVINYTTNYAFYIMFIFSLILNNFLVLWLDKKGKYFWLKTFIINVFFGFCVLVDGSTIKLFLYGSITPGIFVQYVIFGLGQYLLTGNWLLPLIFNSIDKIRDEKEDVIFSVEIDGKKNRNHDRLLETIADKLNFPEGSGESWESVSSGLQDLNWLNCNKVVITVKNPQFLLIEEKKEDRYILEDSLKAAAEYWKEKKKDMEKGERVIDFTAYFVKQF